MRCTKASLNTSLSLRELRSFLKAESFWPQFSGPQKGLGTFTGEFMDATKMPSTLKFRFQPGGDERQKLTITEFIGTKA